MPPVTITADFSPFPDNTVLGPTFALSGFEFTDLGASPSFVNQSGSEKGLQFERTGVRVKLPIATDAVRVHGAAFAGDYRIFGKDLAGNTLAVERMPGDNTPHTVQLAHPGIELLEFVDGNNEGMIATVSMMVCKDARSTIPPSAEVSTIEGRISGLDVIATSGVIPITFAFVTPDAGDEIQVRTTSLQLTIALSAATATDDRVEASYVNEDGQAVLTRLRILDR